jgi:hypothetical protein
MTRLSPACRIYFGCLTVPAKWIRGIWTPVRASTSAAAPEMADANAVPPSSFKQVQQRAAVDHAADPFRFHDLHDPRAFSAWLCRPNMLYPLV